MNGITTVLARRVGSGLLALSAVAAARLDAQESQWRGGLRIAPVFQSWTFSTPVVEDSLHVSKASQMSLPVSVVLPLGDRWTFDASGAYTQGTVTLSGTGANTASSTLTLNGPTDVKMRLVGKVAGDRFRLTLGVNAPSGATGLDNAQARAIGVIGAPALRMPSPVLGSGFGATAGVVMTGSVGDWAVAAGASYEMRGSYSPIEASIAGVASPTDLDPGETIHATLGADRLFGDHRFSMLVSTDIFGEDKISVTGPGNTKVNGTYKLGPGITGVAVLDLSGGRFRELTLAATNRYRSAFRGVDGATAAGSAGNYFDAQARAVIGHANAFGFVLGVDAHFDTGLEVDNSIATAAVTAVGATVGVSIPMGRFSLEPYGRVQTGSLNTGLATTSMKGIAMGVSLASH